MCLPFSLAFVCDGLQRRKLSEARPEWNAGANSERYSEPKVDELAFAERVDRRFNGTFTLSVIVLIAISAGVARFTHLRRRESWSVHFVFALGS